MWKALGLYFSLTEQAARRQKAACSRRQDESCKGIRSQSDKDRGLPATVALARASPAFDAGVGPCHLASNAPQQVGLGSSPSAPHRSGLRPHLGTPSISEK